MRRAVALFMLVCSSALAQIPGLTPYEQSLLEDQFLTRTAGDARYATYTNVYTKTQVNTKLTFYYTKVEADARFEPFDSCYTKSESDLRYEPFDSCYTKAEANALFEPLDSAYTKAESDSKYALAGAGVITNSLATNTLFGYPRLQSPSSNGWHIAYSNGGTPIARTNAHSFLDTNAATWSMNGVTSGDYGHAYALGFGTNVTGVAYMRLRIANTGGTGGGSAWRVYASESTNAITIIPPYYGTIQTVPDTNTVVVPLVNASSLRVEVRSLGAGYATTYAISDIGIYGTTNNVFEGMP